MSQMTKDVRQSQIHAVMRALFTRLDELLYSKISVPTLLDLGVGIDGDECVVIAEKPMSQLLQLTLAMLREVGVSALRDGEIFNILREATASLCTLRMMGDETPSCPSRLGAFLVGKIEEAEEAK